MSIWTAIRVAFLALRLNALRSILAMLGIIIGVASVIIMVSISTGAKREVEKRIQDLGTNLLMVMPSSLDMGGGRQSGAGTGRPFSEEDVDAIRQQIPNIVAASGTVRGSSAVVAMGLNWTTTIYGINDEYLSVRGWTVVEGRNFNQSEIRSGAKVALLGQTVIENLFGNAPPIGSIVRIKNTPFQVIGVLGEKGQSAMGRDNDDVIFVPTAAARNRLFGGHEVVRNYVQDMALQVADGVAISEVQREVEDLLRVRRGVKTGEKDSFSVRNLAEFVQARTATQNTLSLLLASTAAISLVVGGIGIMNIMLVSVTERTREIGLRIALGARRRDIRNQFLVESITLCLVGGLIGLTIGMIGSFMVAQMGQFPISIDPMIALSALGSAGFVGVFFGFFPAQRAAKMNPIDALRYE
ncbi:ABC-type antimicrobial peptide transport system, permease component [Beggiatoa alba B18LD]|uniref:ABC-type antimicrobial peptide transport system, permease component n=1 Tax=Beggiatoa alba B18LD TaxID=395493 RepID=I3CJ18_9GAMM|nr:ABC transporter permease [Beggiatoa alba]EIJ43611.1 ABC-type antimicrobial peptide transport system, permease component [Beggiatoa alba B18LD]